MNVWNCGNSRALRQIFPPRHEEASALERAVDVVPVAAATADRVLLHVHQLFVVSLLLPLHIYHLLNEIFSYIWNTHVWATLFFCFLVIWTMFADLWQIGGSPSSRIRWEDSWSALFTFRLRGLGSRVLFLDLVRRLRATYRSLLLFWRCFGRFTGTVAKAYRDPGCENVVIIEHYPLFQLWHMLILQLLFWRLQFPTEDFISVAQGVTRLLLVAVDILSPGAWDAVSRPVELVSSEELLLQRPALPSSPGWSSYNLEQMIWTIYESNLTHLIAGVVLILRC